MEQVGVAIVHLPSNGALVELRPQLQLAEIDDRSCHHDIGKFGASFRHRARDTKKERTGGRSASESMRKERCHRLQPLGACRSEDDP
jgi:hypothetical protein